MNEWMAEEEGWKLTLKSSKLFLNVSDAAVVRSWTRSVEWTMCSPVTRWPSQ